MRTPQALAAILLAADAEAAVMAGPCKVHVDGDELRFGHVTDPLPGRAIMTVWPDGRVETFHAQLPKETRSDVS